MDKKENVVTKFQNWTSRSVTLKLITISALTLILLIPQSYISNLIRERQNKQAEAEKEVAEKWSDEQTVIGPYLSVPYVVEKMVFADKTMQVEQETIMAYFFPDQLFIDGEIEGIPLSRGVFDIVVYQSKLLFDGKFHSGAIDKLGIDPESIVWDKLKMHVALSDMRGIGDNPIVIINGQEAVAEPYFDKNNNLYGLQVNVPVELFQANVDFTCTIHMKGSKSLSFVPLGKTTEVKLKGDWKDPSFQGKFLPADREVSESGFTSLWKILHFNRPYEQEYAGKIPYLQPNAFGVSLLMPVDQYQKSMRSSKYAVLIIALSFLSLFLMELISKIKLHPFQYALIGLALVLYYSLLVGFSELIGFNYAYLVSSIATIVLLGLYAVSFVANKGNVILFTSLLSLFYVFIFILIEQQESALLLGSIGLFVALAATMFASRKIQWYQE